MKKPTCKYCGVNECMEYPAPHETIISIPFTKIEIRIWNWSKPQFSDMCADCSIDKDNEIQRRHYDEVFNQGFEKGFDQGANQINL